MTADIRQRPKTAVRGLEADGGRSFAMLAGDLADAYRLEIVAADLEQARERAMIAAEKAAWERHVKAKGWR